MILYMARKTTWGPRHIHLILDQSIPLISSKEFMGVFLRSCIVLSVCADLLRFAYLLMIDAWRPDAFEAYRRLVV